MSEEILYTGSVGNIAALLAALKLPAEAYLLVESMPQQVVAAGDRQHLLRFTRLSALDSPEQLANFGSGRVFQGDFELRWEQVSGQTQVVFLGTKGEYEETLQGTPGLTQDKETLQHLTAQTREYYLFGQLLAADNREHMGVPALVGTQEAYYAEARIPRLLRYPIEAEHPTKEQRVQLLVKEYSDKSTGQIRLFRFSGLKAVE